MSRGLNKTFLIGNLGRDPEIKYMPSGDALANLAVATTDSWKDKTSGERVEKTEWHRVVLFKRLAEIAAEYLKKGSKVYIEGSLRTRKWQAQDGSDRYTTEIVANDMQMLGSSNNGAGHSQANSQQGNQRTNSAPDYNDVSGDGDPFDDYIPGWDSPK